MWQKGIKGAPGAVGGAFSGAVRGMFGKKENTEFAEPEVATGINKWFLEVFFKSDTNISPLEDLWNATPKDLKVGIEEEGRARRNFIKDIRVATLEFICKKFNCSPEEAKAAVNMLGYNITDNLIADYHKKVDARLTENFNQHLEKNEWKQFFAKMQASQNEVVEAEYDASKSCKYLLLSFFTEDFKLAVEDPNQVASLQASVLEYFCEKFNCTAGDIKNLFKLTIQKLEGEEESAVVFHAAEEPAVEIHASGENIASIEKKLETNFEIGGDDWDKFYLGIMKEISLYKSMKSASGIKPSTHQFTFFDIAPSDKSIKDFLNYEFFGPQSSLQKVVDEDSSFTKEQRIEMAKNLRVAVFTKEQKIEMAKNLRVAVVKSLCQICACTAKDLKAAYGFIGDDVMQEFEEKKTGGLKQVLSSLVPKKSSTLKPENKDKEID